MFLIRGDGSKLRTTLVCLACLSLSPRGLGHRALAKERKGEERKQIHASKKVAILRSPKANHIVHLIVHLKKEAYWLKIWR